MVQEIETSFDDKCMFGLKTTLQRIASLYLDVEFCLFLFNFWYRREEQFLKKI